MARPRGDIEPRIVHAARARFVVEGVDGASLRTIARDAGTNIGMISYYFATKEELFLAVVEEVYAKLLADLEKIFAVGGPLAGRIRAVSERLGTMSATELDVVRLVVREALASSERFHRLLSRFKRGHLPMMLSALAAGVEKGEVSSDIPLPVLLVCTFGIAALPQIARRAAGREPPMGLLPEPVELADLVTGVLFQGIGAAQYRNATKRRATTDGKGATKVPKARSSKPKQRPRRSRVR
jgi:AcrR family transcriptional regulator